jgi:hypothetical protein
MQPVIDAIDSKAVLAPLPPLQPQHAATRIGTLLSSPTVTRIDNLAEITMFHRRDLIDAEQYEQVIYYAAGEDGLRLILGTPEERAEIATRMVHRQLGIE